MNNLAILIAFPDSLWFFRKSMTNESHQTRCNRSVPPPFPLLNPLSTNSQVGIWTYSTWNMSIEEVFQSLNYYVKRRDKRTTYSFSSVLKKAVVSTYLSVEDNLLEISKSLYWTKAVRQWVAQVSWPVLTESWDISPVNSNGRSLENEITFLSYISVTVTFLYRYLYTLFM